MRGAGSGEGVCEPWGPILRHSRGCREGSGRRGPLRDPATCGLPLYGADDHVLTIIFISVSDASAATKGPISCPSANCDSPIVMVNSMCPSGWTTVPRHVVKHYSACFGEECLWVKLTHKSLPPPLTWVVIIQSVEGPKRTKTDLLRARGDRAGRPICELGAGPSVNLEHSLSSGLGLQAGDPPRQPP